MSNRTLERKTKTEFSTKFDVSIDSKGFARIEKIPFDAYNESTTLEKTVENYKKYTKVCLERILVNQIYRAKKHVLTVKKLEIGMSGPLYTSLFVPLSNSIIKIYVS